MRFNVYQISRQGGREKNEDRMGYSYTRHAGLFALADGMGGHPEGEVAAQLALQTLAGRFQRECKPRLAEPAAFLQEAIVAGHHQLQRYGERKSMRDTPRTTVVACVLQGNQAHWAHCGDSRLYLLRGGRLLTRTRDHSYAEIQTAQGAGGRYNRNVLFTCLGSPGMPVIDSAGPQPLQAGDRLLLCSDGLWGTVSDELITQGLSEGVLGESVQALVELALRNGGARSDNVTALAMEWEAAEADEDEALSVEQPLASGARDPAFAATMHPLTGPRDHLPKAEDIDIDRSIREINDAIRRTPSRPKP